MKLLLISCLLLPLGFTTFQASAAQRYFAHEVVEGRREAGRVGQFSVTQLARLCAGVKIG
jgi:hypothetical protein